VTGDLARLVIRPFSCYRFALVSWATTTNYDIMANKKNKALAGLVASGAVNLDQIVQYLGTWKGTE